MPFERFLLLWDELDELTGAIRHGALHLAHDLKGYGQDLAAWAATWSGPGANAAVAVLPEASPEA